MMWDDGDGFGGHSGMMYGGGAMGWLMVIVMVALLVGLAVAVALLLRRRSPSTEHDDPRASSRNAAHGPSAERILDERLARGEIDEEEYRRRRAALVDG